MNKLNIFGVNRQIIFFSDQGNDLTFDIQGTNSQPKCDSHLDNEIGLFQGLPPIIWSNRLHQSIPRSKIGPMDPHDDI